MAETTTPAAAVESVSESDVVGALEQQFSVHPKAPDKEPPKQEAESEADQPDSELPDVSEGDEPTQDAHPDESFDIVHNGQTVKLSRADLIANAQKGFDYDRKVQAAAQERKMYSEGLQRLAEIEQVQPQLAQELGHITALQRALSDPKYSDQEIYRLAQEDPFESQKRLVERDMLRNNFQQTAQAFEQKAGYIAQQRQHLTAQLLQQEAQRLPELVPAWKDQARFESDSKEMAKYIQSYGMDPAEVNARYLNNAFAMKVLRQSMLYEKSLARVKESKLRDAPPVVRPGNAPQDKGRQGFKDGLKAIKEAGRRNDHSAQQKFMEGLLGKTFK